MGYDVLKRSWVMGYYHHIRGLWGNKVGERPKPMGYHRLWGCQVWFRTESTVAKYIVHGCLKTVRKTEVG